MPDKTDEDGKPRSWALESISEPGYFIVMKEANKPIVLVKGKSDEEGDLGVNFSTFSNFKPPSGADLRLYKPPFKGLTLTLTRS